MLGPVLIATALAAMVQGDPAGPDREQEDVAAIDAAVAEEPPPMADRRLYTGQDVCAVLRIAYPALGRSSAEVKPRQGAWGSIPFVQNGLRISGPWGQCILKWRQFPPQIHQILITREGRHALVEGGSVYGGECHFIKAGQSWRKVTCFNTWVE